MNYQNSNDRVSTADMDVDKDDEESIGETHDEVSNHQNSNDKVSTADMEVDKDDMDVFDTLDMANMTFDQQYNEIMENLAESE